MAVLTLDEEFARAEDVRPFSNAEDGERWMQQHCADCRLDDYADCPLLAVALFGRTPNQWLRNPDGGVGDRYTCTEFKRRV